MTDFYALGNTQAEHERLSRQAAMLAPFTAHAFRSAGIQSGDRVLDIGSGAGDVSILLAEIVGSSGSVLGIERSSASVAYARGRVSRAGLRNITFVEADVNEITSDAMFDAAAGRFILEFVPEPAVVLRGVAQRVRPGGVLAFLEPSWQPLLTLCSELPVTSRAVTLARDTLVRDGADVEFGLKLRRTFAAADLPLPALEMNAAVPSVLETARWIVDLLQSLHVEPEPALIERIEEELATSAVAVPILSLVAGWCSK